MSDGSTGNDGGSRSPWFDPVAGAKALGDIQAQGLRAAGDLVDRLVHLVDGPATTDDVDARDRSGANGQGPATQLAEMWAELLRQSVDLWSRFPVPGSPAPAGGPVVDVGAAGLAAALVLVGRAGERLRSEVWLHNGTAEAVGPLSLRAGPLTDVDGATLEATVELVPEQLPELVGRSSRGVDLVVTPAADSEPGTYRAVLQVAGAPRIWLSLEVEVVAPA
jgi:hypothetical protein